MTTTRIYIGGLPGDIREGEVEDIFAPYGRIRSIDVKGGRDERSAFAFVDFTDDRDADEACYREHGRTFAGGRLRVEPSHGPRDRGYSSGGGYGGGYGADRYDDRGYGGYRDEPRRGGLGPSPYGPSRKTDFQCIVSNLEPRMSWQDLKDHFREYRLEVTHADVDGRGEGQVSFATQGDMDDALRKCDSTVMKNMRGECTIYVDPAGGRGGGFGGDSYRSPSPVRRSRSRSPGGY